MTDDEIALRELLEKGSDVTFQHEMIGFTAQRLMEFETEAMCGTRHGERSAEQVDQRNGCRDLAGVRLRGLRHRHLRALHRRVVRLSHGPGGVGHHYENK